MTTRRREILCAIALASCAVLCLSEERPRDLFDGAAETARMVDDSYRRIYRLVEVAEALTTAGEPTRASALLDEAAKGVGQIAAEDWRDAAWVEIARARIALKEYRGALAADREIRGTPSWIWEDLTGIARRADELPLLEELLADATRLSDAQWRSGIQLEAAVALARQGSQARADAVLTSALADIEKMPQSRDACISRLEAAKACRILGRPAEAARLLKKALRFAKSVRLNGERALALEAVAEYHAETGEPQKAWRIAALTDGFGGVDREFYHVQALRALGLCHIKKQEYRLALEAAKRLAAVSHASKTDVVDGLLELSKKLHESQAEAQSLEMLTMARRVAEAIPTTEEAQKANALTGVASGLLDSGRSDSALPLYDEAAKLVRDSEEMRKRFGNRSSAEVLVNIAEGQCRLGQAEAALRTLQAALVEARGIDEGERWEHVFVDGHPGSAYPLTEKYVKFRLLGRIAVIDGQLGLDVQAAEAVESISSTNWASEASANVAVAVAAAGRMKKAAALTNAIADPYYRAQVLTEAAKLCASREPNDADCAAWSASGSHR